MHAANARVRDSASRRRRHEAAGIAQVAAATIMMIMYLSPGRSHRAFKPRNRTAIDLRHTQVEGSFDQ